VILTIVLKVAPDHDEAATASWPLPALLRAARFTFALAVRGALEGTDFDDLPPNGPYVLGAMARSGAPLAAIIRQLGVSKQTAGQLIDTLVARGYLDRRIDPADRRRLVLALTARGEAAAAVVRGAVAEVEAGLEERVGSRRVAATRRTLAVLIAARSDGA
jgi:DNA-binding MarR family transcriptional regulator